MKDLMNSTDTMSSLEIAELTGKRHDNVMRDIENVLKEVGLGALKFEGTYLDNSNRQSKYYNLPHLHHHQRLNYLTIVSPFKTITR